MTLAKSLRIGIIGASPERGWAKESHVPAVKNLEGLELAAVATNDQKSADAAAHAFGAKAAYGKAEDLIRDPNVNLVTIAVKVPDHRELVFLAVSEGKHIYCEWPLGRNLDETEELAKATSSAGMHTAIGLQTRRNPAALRARELVESGAIGRPLSARLYSSTVAFPQNISEADAYLEKAENGATLMSIHGGHALDLAISVLGPFENIAALATTQFPEVSIGHDGKRQARSIPDHVLVVAYLARGAACSAEVAGGQPAAATRFRLCVTGEKGDLALEGGAPRGFQSGRLRLTLNGETQQIEEGEAASLSDAAANVALMYSAIRDDIQRGTITVPDFRHAVRLTRLTDDVLLSAQTGTRKLAADWPVE